jgi:chaperonin GroEL
VTAKVKEAEERDFGFNAQTEQYENLVKAGVIDPTKVVRTALQNAVSVATLLNTTDALIADAPKDDEKDAGGAGMDDEEMDY